MVNFSREIILLEVVSKYKGAGVEIEVIAILE